MKINSGTIFYVAYPDSYAISQGIRCTGFAKYVCAETPEEAAEKVEEFFKETNVCLGKRRLIQVHKFNCIW